MFGAAARRIQWLRVGRRACPVFVHRHHTSSQSIRNNIAFPGALLGAASFAVGWAAQSEGVTLKRYFSDDYDVLRNKKLRSGAFGMVLPCIHKTEGTIAAVKVQATSHNE
jgi:hypothetical protein